MRKRIKTLSGFAVFILSHRRADRVITYETLRRSGYTGKIYVVIDDEDPTRAEYEKKFGAELIVFSKKKAAEITDVADNAKELRGVVYARNMNFKIAEDLGIKHFIQLDDDYRHFQFRFDDKGQYCPMVSKNLDRVFAALVRFYISSGAATVAISQGGDFIGGSGSPFSDILMLKRKAMNLFVCSTERPFRFYGRINEDTTAYVHLGSTGKLFFTSNQISLEQTQTQANAGGLTEIYLDSGTYVKSFYSVIFQPSCVKVKILQSKNQRLHHSVAWKNAVPMILREQLRKPNK